MGALNKAIDKQSLRALSPLGKLTPDKIDDIISKSRVENMPAGRIVFRQGEDDGQTIYLLSGQIELSTAGKTRKQTIKAKSVDAKFPLADKIPRPVTARTKTASSLLYIDSSLLEILLDDNPSGEYEVTEINIAHHETDWMMRFLQSRTFLKLPTENIQKVLMSMEEIHANKGDAIIQQGEDGDYYYIIKHGCCTVSRRPTKNTDEVRLAQLVEGDGFGEEALINNAKRNATVTINENGTLMRLKKQDFLSLLVSPLIKNVHLNSLKSSLYKNSIVIDIRTSNEFKQGSIDNAKHIPLSMIRLRIPTLDINKQYLLYSDNKDDAKAAAFLLTQHGIEGMVVLGSLQQTMLIADTPEKIKKTTTRGNETEKLKIVSNQQTDINIKDSSSPKPKQIQSVSIVSEITPVPSNNIQNNDSISTQQEHRQKTKLLQQAKNEAQQMLAEAKAIRQSAEQDASSLRNKIEKEETLKLRAELEETRNRAEVAIQKSEQLAKNIRQQAEQESDQIRQQAREDAEKVRQGLNHLHEQERQKKKQLETELQAIREQITRQASLDAKHDAEQAKSIALQEAEKTRANADKAAAETRALADKFTAKARAIEKEAEQARTDAEKEALAIRQTALKEASIIKQKAIKDSNKITKPVTPAKKFIISHNDIFNLDDISGPEIEPVQPYADEASIALKMAEEIKVRLEEVEQQRIENERTLQQNIIKHSAKITRLDGKLILEGNEDVFIFKEPQQHCSEKNTVEETIPQASSEQTQGTDECSPTMVSINELPSANPIISENFSLPAYDVDNILSNETEKAKKSILAIAASIFLVISLSLVAYTTKIQINFTEVGALVNQDSIETENDKLRDKARKEFLNKISSVKGK